MEKGCKKEATNNKREMQIKVVIFRATFAKMVPKRLQQEGPKSEILEVIY